ncbi:hypothetical protein [Bartonella sp. HY406]|uniref:hypothetical protein n=1 Tax=Bartonella sp. HY406 TaxID=2979331 RepID=UPI0021C9E15C|nr:hypothetical protein [Bartonella sp. HY406]UXN03343.1 hypothetical protein N6B01_13000 [Bartonella sp. HY406]
MIKFFKIAISILLISSLLAACTKKPEYYQAAYSGEKHDSKPKLNPNNVNNRQKQKETDKAQPRSESPRQSRPMSTFELILLTPVFLIAVLIGELSKPSPRY